MNIEAATQDWLDGLTIKQTARKHSINKESMREALIDYLGQSRYRQEVTRKWKESLPPTRKRRDYTSVDVEGASREWLAGATLDDVRKRYGVGNSARMGRMIREHIGNEAYNAGCSQRRAESGKGAWRDKRQLSLHPVFTRAWV